MPESKDIKRFAVYFSVCARNEALPMMADIFLKNKRIGKNRFSTQLRLSEDCVFWLGLSLSMKSMRLTSPSAIYYQRLREGSAMHLKTSRLTDIKELWAIEVTYLKFWVVHFWKVNPLLMLSRIAAGIRNTRIKMKNK